MRATSGVDAGESSTAFGASGAWFPTSSTTYHAYGVQSPHYEMTNLANRLAN